MIRDQNGLANENDPIVGGSPYGAATYQNFIVGSRAKSQRFVHQQPERPDPATGYWEIRSGISEGNVGTLIASGTGATSHQTPVAAASASPSTPTSSPG